MGLFDSLQNIIGGVSDGIQGPVDNIAQSVSDNSVVQDIQDQASSVAENGGEVISSESEQGQNIVDDVTTNLGL